MSSRGCTCRLTRKATSPGDCQENPSPSDCQENASPSDCQENAGISIQRNRKAGNAHCPSTTAELQTQHTLGGPSVFGCHHRGHMAPTHKVCARRSWRTSPKTLVHTAMPLRARGQRVGGRALTPAHHKRRRSEHSLSEQCHYAPKSD